MNGVPKKYIFQIGQDIVLTGLFLLLMGFFLWGEAIHEWAGVIFFLLILPHVGLNPYWFRKLFNEPFSIYRGLQVFLNISLSVAMLIATVSGLMLSQHAMPNLPIHSDSGFVRELHIWSVYWMVLIVGMHLGIHWNMLKAFLCRLFSLNAKSFFNARVLPAMWIALSAVGLYQFITRDIASLIFFQTAYAFFDFKEPMWLFYFSFFTMLIFFAYATHFLIWLMLFRKAKT